MSRYLYKYKAWKKKTTNITIDGKKASVISKLRTNEDTKVPRMGGLVVVLPVIVVTLLFWALAYFTDNAVLDKFNFLSREQTWLLLFALVVAAIIGFVDDFLTVRGVGYSSGGGISLKGRLLLVVIIGLVGAYWFYFRLGVDTIHIPAFGDVFIGWFIIPLYLVVTLATFGSSVVDGLDGLSGGTFLLIFAAYAGIAIVRGQIDIATFLGVLIGALLAFLWFNIPPARFYMTETGILPLTMVLTVVAFMTDSVVVLPIIGIILVMEVGGNIIQILSKKFRGKKVFLAAPIHHHFEAKGWPKYKVTMRFWVIGAVAAMVGMVIGILGGGNI